MAQISIDGLGDGKGGKLAGLGSLTARHWRLLLILFILHVADGFDLLAMSFAAPSIAREWMLAPTALGLVFSGAQIGGLLGAFSVGALAHRFGRKPVLLSATLLIGGASLATAFAWNVPSLLAFRFATGIGLGIISPLLAGYSSEFFPTKTRGAAVAIVVSGMQFGQITGGIIAAIVVPYLGWEAVFIIGSIVPLALLAPLAALPAAPLDMVRSGADDAEIERVCASYGIDRPSAEQTTLARAWLPLRAIVAERRGRLFAALVGVMMLGPFVTYFLNTWAVVLLEDRGAAHAAALLCLSFLHGGALVGILLLGWLMGRVSSRIVLPASILASAPLVVAMGFAPPSPILLYGFFFAVGVLLAGGLTSNQAYSTIAFPNHVRVHVIAYLVMVARGAGVVAPIGAGYMLAAGFVPGTLFIILGGFVVAAALVQMMGSLSQRSSPAGS